MSNLSPKEKKEKINEHNALVRRINRNIEENDSKESVNSILVAETEEDEVQVDAKTLFMETVKSQRDRRLVLMMILLLFEKKSYKEIEENYGFGTNTISRMQNAINSGAIRQEIEKEKDNDPFGSPGRNFLVQVFSTELDNVKIK